MRRRRLSLACAILSALLCLTAVVLWVRSYYVRDVYVARYMEPTGGPADAHHSHRSVISSGGCVTFNTFDITTRGDPARRPEAPLSMRTWVHQPNRGEEILKPVMPRPGTFWNRLGFGVERGWFAYAGKGTSDSWSLTLPWWAIILLAAVWPAYLSRRRHARLKRRRAGLCPECGYDLRASPERCPECGTIPSGTSATRPLAPVLRGEG